MREADRIKKDLLDLSRHIDAMSECPRCKDVDLWVELCQHCDDTWRAIEKNRGRIASTLRLFYESDVHSTLVSIENEVRDRVDVYVAALNKIYRMAEETADGTDRSCEIMGLIEMLNLEDLMPKSLDEVLASEVSPDFLQYMKNRMATSFYKYGAVAKNYPEPKDALKNLRERLKKYEDTGNTEWLVDVANFAMIEFMRPRRPGAAFRATDSDESPGLRE